ncbi:MAG: bacterioferritin [Caldithrix sp.]|nr:bacterioferritin [Caldithrix sp.]
MSMHEESITLLNKAIADEMTAVHQYMYFHFHCDDQSFDLLAGMFKRSAIDEMTHVEDLSERILFLKGEIELKASRAVKNVHDIKSMLEMACQMESDAVKAYNTWANECAKNADSVTKKLFEDLVADEEQHFDQFDTELENIAKFGERYLALQSIERSKNMGAPPAE